MLASDHFFNLEVWTSIRNVRDEAEGVDQEMGLAGEEGVAGASPAGSIAAPSTIEMSTGKPKAYVSFTISDGDNLQYDQHRMVRLWQDPARGTIPIGWTISPALLRVTPVLAGYYTRTATPNDELIAGPSGAGYMLPSHWPSEHLPAFLQRTGELMQSMNLSVLEVLDSGSWMSMALINQGLQQQYVEALARYGVQGILSGAGQAQPGWRIIGGVPVLQNLGLANTVDKAVSLVRNASMQSRHQASPLFLNVYILAWSMTPSDLKRVIQQLGSEYEVITPGRLFAMIMKVQQAFHSL
jgi:putative glycoside hydrolase with GxGYxYP motif